MLTNPLPRWRPYAPPEVVVDAARARARELQGDLEQARADLRDLSKQMAVAAEALTATTEPLTELANYLEEYAPMHGVTWHKELGLTP